MGRGAFKLTNGIQKTGCSMCGTIEDTRKEKATYCDCHHCYWARIIGTGRKKGETKSPRLANAEGKSIWCSYHDTINPEKKRCARYKYVKYLGFSAKSTQSRRGKR